VFPCAVSDFERPKTPSHIPKLPSRTPTAVRPLKFGKTPLTKHKHSPTKVEYMTRDSNTPAPAWDTKGRLEDMESLYSQLKSQFEGAAFEKTGLEESLTLYKTRCVYSATAEEGGILLIIPQ